MIVLTVPGLLFTGFLAHAYACGGLGGKESELDPAVELTALGCVVVADWFVWPDTLTLPTVAGMEMKSRWNGRSLVLMTRARMVLNFNNLNSFYLELLVNCFTLKLVC